MRTFANQQNRPHARGSSNGSPSNPHAGPTLRSPRTKGHHAVQRILHPQLAAVEAPPAVNEVLRSPGQPLDEGARAFLEPRFGEDFSQVRVHSDAGASWSAEAVNARAYTVGADLIFGRGEYAPGTAQGRSLIAHELTHVVQQRSATGRPPVLQRVDKAKTSGGEYIADPYDAMVVPGNGGIVAGYGVNIDITFKANDNVDAKKIAFVQTAQSVKDGRIHNRFQNDKDKREVLASRMLPAGPDGGAHIDQMPDVRTPLYGMTGNRGNDLSEPEPAKKMKLTEIGWHYKDASGNPQNHDAMMHDEPDLNSGDTFTKASAVMKTQWSQSFETSAVAIDGNQKGTFYGSVEWGWQRGASDGRTSLFTLKTKSMDVPSPAFLEAARLWNLSVTTEKKPTIDLPINMHVYYDGASLWDNPEGKAIATLTKDTPLARTAKVDSKGRTWWVSVVVTGGPSAGKRGWIKGSDLP
jgi:hypothetical protein